MIYHDAAAAAAAAGWLYTSIIIIIIQRKYFIWGGNLKSGAPDCRITNKHTINTGGHGPSRTSDLSGEAGAFDGLGSLLDLVFVAAAMGSDHLTRPGLHVHCGAERRGLINQSNKEEL